MYFALLALLAISFALLAARRFPLALSLLFALLPTYLLRFRVGPLPSTMLEVFILTLGVVWAVRDPAHIKETVRRAVSTPWRYPLGILAVALAVSVVVAPDTVDALGLLKAYFVEPALVLAMVTSTFRESDWQRAWRFLLLAALTLSVIAILQAASGLGIPAPWDIEGRATSVFDFPNAVGLFLAPIVSACIMLAAMERRDTALWRLCVGTAVLGLVAIVLAKTEAALVAIPAALGVAMWLSSLKRSVKQIISVAGLAVLVVLFQLPTVSEKLLLNDYSGSVRRAQWSETLAMLADRPVLGAGLAGYPAALAPYHDPTLYEIFQYPHNLILNIWSEVGLLGLAAFVALGVLFARVAIRERKSAAVLVATTALATMVIHGFVDVPFFKNDLAVLTVFFAGLLLTNPQLAKREAQHPAS